MSSSRHNRELQQEFRVWIENQKVKGLGSPDLSTKLSYVPQQRIAEHFKARRTISQLLQRLDPDQNLESHQDNIIKEYPKVLCILIIIGQGHLIGTFVRHASLGDTQLPFEHKPTHFPFADDGTDFFARFKEVQWQFCIQPLTYNMDRVYEDARILPIMTKDKIGNGGSSHIFKITLPQAYDELEPHDSSEKKNPSYRHAHTYVLKTYRTGDAKSYYANEIRAFRRVLAAGTNHIPGLIGFHGNFTHGGTHNVLLEYADKGTLEQYFQNFPSPTNEDDIVSFWRGLFFPIFALLKIHNLEDQDLENPDIFQGWHQDIKPDNILVVGSDRPSPYKYEFKLADLGLSHFKKFKATDGDAVDTDAWGTKTYGAPESYRCDSLVGPANLRVPKSVDVWSLGCVFSEAATWLVLGKEGLQKYRTDRREETDKIPNFKDDGCFHNGDTVLASVGSTHAHVVACKRRTDHITHHVIRNMVQEMLGVESVRPTAKQLWQKSQILLKQAKEARQSSIWSSSTDSPISSKAPTLKDAVQEPQTGSQVFSQPQSIYGSASRRSIRIETGNITGENRRLERSPERIPETKPDVLESPPPKADSPLDTRIVNHLPDSSKRPSAPPNAKPWTVDEAYLWKESQRKRSFVRTRAAPEGGERYMQLINKRDHVFIVDDSESMRRTGWSTLTSRISLLAYIVKVADDDGLDLYFSSSVTPVHSKKSSELTEAVRQRESQPRGSQSLNQVLEAVLKAFRKAMFGSGTKGFFGKSKQGKPMTCYILTDGAWCSEKGADVEALIKDFVDELERTELHAKSFGIQFISFGNNQEGLEFLEHLDSGLQLERDIVDTEPENGDVWKMLLGSINRKFDNDTRPSFQVQPSPEATRAYRVLE